MAEHVEDIRAILSGTRWRDLTNITFSFVDPQSGITDGVASDVQVVPELLRNAARSALARLAYYTNLTVTEVASGGVIRVGYAHLAEFPNNSAVGFYPGSRPEDGDIWFNTEYANAYADPAYTFYSALHEVGHAFGLKHSFEPFYTLATELDTTDTTVMSYTYGPAYPTDYRVLDVHALQSLYGGHNGTAAADVLAGDDAARTYLGFGGDDTISGGGAADLIYGNQGNDRLSGDAGADIIFGGQGADLIYGNTESDVIYGNREADLLFGGQGHDTIFGGQGADLLVGGRGDDVLQGGLGADTFSFTSVNGSDIVRDYAPGEDRILITGGAAWSISGATLTLDGTTVAFNTAISSADVLVG